MDIVIDSDSLSEIMYQYFKQKTNLEEFVVEGNLTTNTVNKLNSILYWFQEKEGGTQGLIISSTFAFIEIARKFDQIVNGRFSIDQFAAFINSPPEWFSIEPLDNSISFYLLQIPTHVSKKGTLIPLEWTDSIHIATTISRGDDSFLLTNDIVIREITILKNRILHK